MSWRTPFLRPLWHWGLHVPANASVSFIIAYTTDWHRPQAVAGMISGILVFIALYVAVWNSRWFDRYVPTDGLPRRALLYGTRFRSITCSCAALMSLPVISRALGRSIPAVVAQLITLPDFLAGIFADSLITRIGKSDWLRSIRITVAGTDAHQRSQSILVGDVNSLVPTFLITLTEGVLLSLVLLVVSVVVLGVLRLVHQWKHRVRPAPPTLT